MAVSSDGRRSKQPSRQCSSRSHGTTYSPLSLFLSLARPISRYRLFFLSIVLPIARTNLQLVLSVAPKTSRFNRAPRCRTSSYLISRYLFPRTPITTRAVSPDAIFVSAASSSLAAIAIYHLPHGGRRSRSVDLHNHCEIGLAARHAALRFSHNAMDQQQLSLKSCLLPGIILKILPLAFKSFDEFHVNGKPLFREISSLKTRAAQS